MLALGLELTSLVLLFIIIFALMLCELASRLVLTSLTAAPPHLTSIYTFMRPATPVEIFFLMIFLSTQFTHLDALVDFALATLKLENSLLHLLSFGLEDLALLVQFHAFIQLFVQILSQLFDARFHSSEILFGHHGELELLSVGFTFDINHFFDHVSEFISLFGDYLEAFFELVFLFLNDKDKGCLTVDFHLEFVLEILGIRDGIDTLIEHTELILYNFVTNGCQFFILTKFENLIC
jgi:hypothetical protein